jgi:hypothetical protein
MYSGARKNENDFTAHGGWGWGDNVIFIFSLDMDEDSGYGAHGATGGSQVVAPLRLSK